jgi:hypothetical protein
LAAREFEWVEATPVASTHSILIGRCAGIAPDEESASNRVGYARAQSGVDDRAEAAAFTVRSHLDAYIQDAYI